jgi:hypothetical protein
MIMPTIAHIDVPFDHAEDLEKVNKLNADPEYIAEVAADTRKVYQEKAEKFGPRHGLHGKVTVGMPVFAGVTHT